MILLYYKCISPCTAENIYANNISRVYYDVAGAAMTV